MPLLAAKEGRSSNINELVRDAWSGEVVAFCPQCKVLQTVWINNDKLTLTRKFTQEGGQIYHDCGSSQPCRLYHSW